MNDQSGFGESMQLLMNEGRYRATIVRRYRHFDPSRSPTDSRGQMDTGDTIR